MVRRIIFTLLFGCFVFLTFNKHSKSGYFNYHSEIWADKAGYYIYLPLTFIYNFSSKNLPEDIIQKTGKGFKIEGDVVISKYPIGVAILQAPFFLLAHLSSSYLGMSNDGFSPVYHWAINIAAIFYLFLGLYFLFKTLSNYYKQRSILIGLICLLLGTNLYYYSVDETGMSHIFSFALNCAFLYLIKKSNYLVKYDTKKVLLLGCLSGLILLVRPSNILFLTLTMFIFPNYGLPLRDRIRVFFNFNKIIPLIIGIVITIIPQMIYWNYTSGSLVQYSYEGESFNFLNPELIKFWFAAKSGLFAYNPMYLLFVGFLIVQAIQKNLNTAVIGLSFILISLFFSSWWDWGFGCSMGSRNFVEYSPILVIPFIQGINTLKTKQVIPIVIAGAFFIIYNLKISYAFDGCFYGNSIWDWNTFLKFL